MPPTKRQVHSPHGDHRDGLRFLKLDLHVHTPASRCFGDKSVKADEIVKTALERGLSGIAITDHNSGDWINQVTKASEGTDLVVFPAVEITWWEARRAST